MEATTRIELVYTVCKTVYTSSILVVASIITP